MAPNALECSICCNTFSEDNCPRNLPCSHTFCGPCIDGIIATQKKTCPTCREEFTATSAEDLMICRIALDVVKQLSTINIKPKTSSRGICLKFTEDFLESDTQILMSTEILKEMKEVTGAIEFLKELKGGILDTNKDIEQSVEKMREIKLSNEKTLDIIDQNIKWFKNRMSLILQEDGKTQDADVELQSATNFTSIGPVMDETEEEVLEESQQKIKRIKELLQENGRRRDDITMEILRMQNQLKIVAEDIQKLIEADYLVISAVKTIGGKQMVAPVRVELGNQVRLSHFAEGDLPPKSLVIKHEALMNGSSRRAFLDLAVRGTFLARIVIKVMDEGHLARPLPPSLWRKSGTLLCQLSDLKCGSEGLSW